MGALVRQRLCPAARANRSGVRHSRRSSPVEDSTYPFTHGLQDSMNSARTPRGAIARGRSGRRDPLRPHCRAGRTFMVEDEHVDDPNSAIAPPSAQVRRRGASPSPASLRRSSDTPVPFLTGEAGLLGAPATSGRSGLLPPSAGRCLAIEGEPR